MMHLVSFCSVEDIILKVVAACSVDSSLYRRLELPFPVATVAGAVLKVLLGRNLYRSSSAI
jgi:hypothetical protein